MFFSLLAAGMITVSLGDQTLCVEKAETDLEQRRGLSHRQTLLPDQGMLFVYTDPQGLHFWMKDVHFPLSIAFFDKQGHLLNIENMPVESSPPWTIYTSQGKAQYALEMSLGWFEEHDIRPGQYTLQFPIKNR